MFWNKKIPVMQIPDEFFQKNIKFKKGEVKTYAISQQKKCLIIQTLDGHSKPRDCIILYESGNVVEITAEEYKPHKLHGGKKK